MARPYGRGFLTETIYIKTHGNAAFWGSKVSPATISELNKKAYVHIEDWRNRPLHGGKYPYVYVDGIYLRRD